MDTFEYPEFKEDKRNDHVAMGQNDQYPEYLHELYSTVAIHCAVINTTADMIAGQGFRPGKMDAFYMNFAKAIDKKLAGCLAFDLKLSGNAYVIGIWSNDREEIAEFQYAPHHTIRAEKKDESGKVCAYYQKDDWTSKDDPERIPVYDGDNRTYPKFIYHIRRHDPQARYYGVPDYLGGTQVMELEKSIKQFHLNNVKNGMFPSFHFAFHNGQPDEEQQGEIERKVKQKFGGSQKAGAQLFTYDGGPDENALDINPIEANGNHDMFAHLNETNNNDILSAHGVTSPLLFGVRGSTGFGSNSEELEVATKLYTFNRVRPMQALIIDAFEEMTGASIEIQDLMPVGGAEGNVAQSYTGIQISSAKDVIIAVQSGEIPKAAGIAMLVQMLQFPEDVAQQMLSNDEETAVAELPLEMESQVATWLVDRGEDEPEGYELLFSHPVEYDLEDELNQSLETFQALELARTVRSSPGKDSEQDTSLFKIRYRYESTNTAAHSSREFCRRMDAANKIYRKEDIIAAGNQTVNPGWGPGGAATYSVWLYKGGGACQHRWVRQVYLKSGGQITPGEASRMILDLPITQRAAARWEINESQVATAPRFMPKKGFLK